MSRYFGVAKPVLKGLGRICYLEPEFLAMADQKMEISAPYNLVRVDGARRAEAAVLFTGMICQEIRALFYVVKYPDISVQDSKKGQRTAPQAVNVPARP